MNLSALAISVGPAFIASGVEFIEATTIILAVGVTRGWRAPIYGTIAAAVTLAAVIGVFGATLVTMTAEEHDHALRYSLDTKT